MAEEYVFCIRLSQAREEYAYWRDGRLHMPEYLELVLDPSRERGYFDCYYEPWPSSRAKRGRMTDSPEVCAAILACRGLLDFEKSKIPPLKYGLAGTPPEAEGVVE